MDWKKIVILPNIEIDSRVKTKLTEIINKIETIIVKEIECISEFIYEVYINNQAR